MSYLPQADGSSTCCDCPDRVSPCDNCGGACCHEDNSCTMGTQAQCDDAGGSYQGDGVPCDGVECGCCWICNTSFPNVASGWCDLNGIDADNCSLFRPGDAECDDCSTTHGSATLTVSGHIDGFFTETYECSIYNPDTNNCELQEAEHTCTVSFSGGLSNSLVTTTNVFCDGSIFLDGAGVSDIIAPEDFITECVCDSCPQDEDNPCDTDPNDPTPPDCLNPSGSIGVTGGADLQCFGEHAQWTVQSIVNIPMPLGGFANHLSDEVCCFSDDPEFGTCNDGNGSVGCTTAIGNCNESSGSASFSGTSSFANGGINWGLSFSVS